MHFYHQQGCVALKTHAAKRSIYPKVLHVFGKKTFIRFTENAWVLENTPQ